MNDDPQLAALLLNQEHYATDEESQKSTSIHDESKKYVVGLNTRNIKDIEKGQNNMIVAQDG